MPSSIQAILFDFGNVLVKWDMHNIYDAHFPSPADVDAFLEEVRFFEWNSHMDRGLPFSEGVARASAQFPHYAHLFQLWSDRWFDTVCEPIEGSIAIARVLKEAGYPLYILSNVSEEKFPQARKAHAFLSMFEDIFISSEFGLVKPEPEIFRQTLQRMNRPAEEVIFIDDALANIESARKLGLQSIHFQSPAQLERELKTLQIL